jgi:SAM-dependent methyltransferase
MASRIFERLSPVWARLPLSFRESGIARWLKLAVGYPLSPATSADPGTPLKSPQVVTTLEELDEMLVMLDAAAAISDDELRRGFSRFEMRFPLDLPKDPDTPEYRAVQMELYEWLHGKPYSVSNEVTEFDLEKITAQPFPYYTESPSTVGNQLIAVGNIIRTLDLEPKSSVLEFGPGWGNTTIALARMGYHVTAIDIEKNFVDLVRERARQKGLVNIEIHHGDFSMISTLEKQFDAILFFECFHHCSDHHALIRQFDRVVAPGGRIVFAGEPIVPGFPMPWGLRLDGESLWAIRKNGWLELGFEEGYFRSMMSEHGWDVDKKVCSETPWGVTFTATRSSG